MVAIDANENVRNARDRHLAAAEQSTRAYDDPKFVVRVGALSLRLPNPGFLHLHDLHHVALGYDTSLVGEAEVSAFELRAGWGKPLIFLLCLGSISIGVLWPRRLWRAWRRARGTQSLYKAQVPYEDLLTMTVGELRRLIGLDDVARLGNAPRGDGPAIRAP